MRRSDYERQPAPQFLFERRPLRRWPPVDPQSDQSFVVARNQPAHRAMRQEERAIPRDDAPILTVTSDPYTRSPSTIGGIDSGHRSNVAIVTPKTVPLRRRTA
jgi:hypothetical protein